MVEAGPRYVDIYIYIYIISRTSWPSSNAIFQARAPDPFPIHQKRMSSRCYVVTMRNELASCSSVHEQQQQVKWISSVEDGISHTLRHLYNRAAQRANPASAHFTITFTFHISTTKSPDRNSFEIKCVEVVAMSGFLANIHILCF